MFARANELMRGGRSSLAIDLILSRVGLAALKSCMGDSADPSELEAAKNLKRIFELELSRARMSDTSQGPLRTLQGAMPTPKLTEPLFVEASESNLDILSRLLDELLDKHVLTSTQAVALVNALRNVRPRDMHGPTEQEVGLLGESSG